MVLRLFYILCTTYTFVHPICTMVYWRLKKVYHRVNIAHRKISILLCLFYLEDYYATTFITLQHFFFICRWKVERGTFVAWEYEKRFFVSFLWGYLARLVWHEHNSN